MVVSNNGDLKTSSIYLMMLDSVTTQKDGKQLIKYQELRTTLEKLFTNPKLTFVKRKFIRNPPVNGICS
ncbi:MAG: hypothetical protein K0S63_1004 [Gammaproteobacteria bacterium]|jgi:hypothetical protein|nr:hypothetical protein [Gammaproteobacteria bacterium]